MTVPKMTIGGRRVKCRFCGRTAKVVTKYNHPVCGHCFKAFALGLVIGRCCEYERTMNEKLKLANENTLYGKVKE